MKRLLIIAALVCGTAHADFKDGNKLLSELQSQDNLDWGISMGYIEGVADAWNGVTHCMSSNTTAGQLRDMVKQYLERNPAIRHYLAERVIREVMKATFPCAKQPSGRTL